MSRVDIPAAYSEMIYRLLQNVFKHGFYGFHNFRCAAKLLFFYHLPDYFLCSL
jgi:hypothetical protein